MANVAWFNVFPSNETQSGSTVPPGTHTVMVAVGSAAYNAWLGNGAYQGQQVFTGPFTSAAEAAQDLTGAHPGPPPGTGLIAGLALGAGNQKPASALQTGTSVAGSISSIEQFLSIFTERAVWIRVGEVLLGLVLISAGTLKLAESSGTVGQAAKAAVKVNPTSRLVASGLKLKHP